MTAIKLTVHDVPGDGDCFFHALYRSAHNRGLYGALCAALKVPESDSSRDFARETRKVLATAYRAGREPVLLQFFNTFMETLPRKDFRRSEIADRVENDPALLDYFANCLPAKRCNFAAYLRVMAESLVKGRYAVQNDVELLRALLRGKIGLHVVSTGSILERADLGKDLFLVKVGGEMHYRYASLPDKPERNAVAVDAWELRARSLVPAPAAAAATKAPTKAAATKARTKAAATTTLVYYRTGKGSASDGFLYALYHSAKNRGLYDVVCNAVNVDPAAARTPQAFAKATRMVMGSLYRVKPPVLDAIFQNLMATFTKNSSVEDISAAVDDSVMMVMYLQRCLRNNNCDSAAFWTEMATTLEKGRYATSLDILVLQKLLQQRKSVTLHVLHPPASTAHSVDLDRDLFVVNFKDAYFYGALSDKPEANNDHNVAGALDLRIMTSSNKRHTTTKRREWSPAARSLLTWLQAILTRDQIQAIKVVDEGAAVVVDGKALRVDPAAAVPADMRNICAVLLANKIFQEIHIASAAKVMAMSLENITAIAKRSKTLFLVKQDDKCAPIRDYIQAVFSQR